MDASSGTGKRATDRSRIAAFWGRYGRDTTTFVAVALAAYAVVAGQNTAGDAEDASKAALRAANSAKAAVHQIKLEAKERINETCRIQETKQKADVDALKRTYEYLTGLEPTEFAQPLNRAVLAGLPTTVREAQTDDAPNYCDEPGVGLPEPDPVIPKRPKGLPGQ